MRKLACLTTVFAVSLSGCNEAGDGVVVREWSKSMRELGIYPVFPPREDLYVGDVFVSYAGMPVPADAPTGFPPMGLFYSSVDVSAALRSHYSLRPEFPASSASPQSGQSVFQPPGVQARLKTVAFPFFLKATASGAEVGALIPVDALPWKAGLGLNSVKSASVSVSAAESYAVPWTQLASQLSDAEGHFGIPSGPGQAASAPETMRLLRQVAVSTDGRPAGYVDVTVISEVFYARTFDVTLHLSSNAALSVAGDIPSAAQGAATAASAVANVATAAAASAAPGAASAAAAAGMAAVAAAAESAKLQGLLDKAKSLAPLTPGVSAGVSVSSTGDIGLRRTYERPIAVGFRGVRYRLSLTSGAATPLEPNDQAAFEGEGGIGKKNKPALAARPASGTAPK